MHQQYLACPKHFGEVDKIVYYPSFKYRGSRRTHADHQRFEIYKARILNAECMYTSVSKISVQRQMFTYHGRISPADKKLKISQFSIAHSCSGLCGFLNNP